MDEYIPVYCINKAKSEQVPYQKAGYKIVYTELGSFDWKAIKSVVHVAQKNAEDIIIILNEAANLRFLPDFNDLYEGLVLAVKEGIHFIHLIGELNFPYVGLNESLSYITDIKETKGFLLTKSLFELILVFNDSHLADFKLEVILNNIFFKKGAIVNSSPTEIADRRINVIVPFRNIEKYIYECCDSILTQYYENFKVYFIDDCSIDKSLSKIPVDERFIILKNEKRKYALENILDILEHQNLDQSDIVIILDGDDKLAHPYVFKLLNEIYKYGKIKLTYGSFTYMNSLKKVGLCYTEDEFKCLRAAKWKASHLKTFEYNIYKEYKKRDPFLDHMRDEEGNILTMPYDIALMFPLLEVSGFDRTFFVKDPVYKYRIHDDNDHFSNRELQYKGELQIRNKKSLIGI